MPKKTQTKTSQLRLIGGEWRARKITFTPIANVRPTPDRIRETLFNWLMFDIQTMYCLDVFAGSGALGLEALSRGAERVIFLDILRENTQNINNNLILLNAKDRAEVYCQNYAQYCQFIAKNIALNLSQKFDLIFLDPPFDLNLWHDGLTKITTILNPDKHFVYLEYPDDIDFSLPENWQWHKQSQAGKVKFGLCCFKDSPSAQTAQD